MKKRFKGLISIWLVAILLVGMLPAQVTATDTDQSATQPPVGHDCALYTGTQALIDLDFEAFVEAYVEDTQATTFQTNVPLHEQESLQAEHAENVAQTGWRLWGLVGCGFAKLGEYECTDEISDADLELVDSYYIIEPLWNTLRVAQQPTAANGYTVGAQVYKAAGSSYAWSDISGTDNVTYRWYQEIPYELVVSNATPSSAGNDDNTKQVRQLEGSYNENTGLWSPVDQSASGEVWLKLSLKPGDTVTVTPDSTSDGFILCLFYNVGPGSLNNSKNGAFQITNNYGEDDDFEIWAMGASFKLSVTHSVALEGRTSASLLTGNGEADPLTEGTYLCKVSYDSATDDETNHVYTAWSDPVEYSGNATVTHTNHCICGKTHADVGDHDEAVSTTFTAVTTQDELQAAAESGGNVYLADDIAIDESITVPAGGTLTLCLNGMKLYYEDGGNISIFTLEEGATLNITDCGDTERPGYVDGSTYLWTPGNAEDESDIPYNLTGGLITGGTGCKTNPNSSYSYGGAVYANPGSNFNLYGGNIAGNDTTYAGGGVCGKNASVAVYGGCMVGNDTGAITIWDTDIYGENYPSLSIYRGKLEYNRAPDNYTGEIDVNGPITMTGGTVTAEHSNMAMQSTGNAFTMTGGTVTCNQHWGTAVQFNGNPVYTETQEGNTVYLTATPAKVTLSGGTINAPSAGYGLALFYSYSDLYLSGTPVLTDNNSYAAIAIFRAEENDTWEDGGITYVASCSGGHIVLTGQLSWQEPVLIQVFAEGSDEYADPSTLDFTKGWSTYMGDADPADYFTSGHYGAEVAKNAQTGELKMAVSYDVILRDADGFEPAQTENGSYDVDKYFAAEGATVTITAEPDEGYEVDQVTVSAIEAGPMSLSATEEQDEESAEILVTKNSDGTYSFVMPAYAVEVQVTFKVKTVSVTVTVTANPTEGGTVTGNGTYNHGASVTLTATPETGYHFVNWTKNGNVVSTEATFTFTATENAEYVANFELNSYTITWKNDDGSVIDTTTVEYGTVPTHADPTKEATAQYTYTFSGWTPTVEAVTGEATYTATYSSTVNKYTIKFVDEDGTVLQSSEVAYGETPAYTGETPAKAATAQYTYTFAGWDKTIAAVTGEATYKATYTSTVNKYTVTYKADGNVVATVTVEYGKDATAPEIPAKTGYTAVWDKDGKNITADTEINAVYTINKYIVTYKADGNVVKTVEVEYGKDATAPEIPAKTGYTAVWDKDGKNITADTEINAVYTINKYIVTYKADGNVVKTVEVEYGKDATAPEIPAKTGYTAVWDKDGKKITADTEINAVYTINKYTVTYKADGKVVKTVEVEHGKDATAPEIPAKTGYTAVWDKDGKNITADTEINAVYTINKYTVTYKADGQIVATVTVEHGKDATAPEIPAKAGHTATWDKDGKNITADTEINAVYTINKYTVTYKADGQIVATVTVEHGKDATAPEIPAKAGYTAAWDKDGKNITADTEINAVYTINKYTVTYKADGQIVATVTVEHGKDATAPEIPAKEGYNETAPKWDKDGKNITADTEINAVYTINKYTVTYKADGQIVATVTVEHGKDATAPEIPAKAGYTAAWDKDGKNITADTEINAVYTINKYTVTYKADGQIVATVTVEHGKDATAPEIPAKEGYNETAPKWDKDGKNITADTEINAVYTKNQPGEYADVTPDTNVGGGKVTEEIEELKEKVPFTQEEEKQIEYGADVEVWLEIKDISDSVPPEDKAKVEEKLGDADVALYLDIAMFKQVGENEASRLTQLSGKVRITFKLPDEYINTDKNVIRTYSIIHVHNGKAEIITPAFDAQTNTLTFETDRFSTYAAVYTDEKETPETGDSFQPVFWTSVMVLSAAAVAVLLVEQKKKRTN